MKLKPNQTRLRVLVQLSIAMLVVFGLAAGGWAQEKGKPGTGFFPGGYRG